MLIMANGDTSIEELKIVRAQDRDFQYKDSFSNWPFINSFNIFLDFEPTSTHHTSNSNSPIAYAKNDKQVSQNLCGKTAMDK
jgi:hypothetical protein